MDHIYGTFWPPVHPPVAPNSGSATAIFHHLWRIMTWWTSMNSLLLMYAYVTYVSWAWLSIVHWSWAISELIPCVSLCRAGPMGTLIADRQHQSQSQSHGLWSSLWHVRCYPFTWHQCLRSFTHIWEGKKNHRMSRLMALQMSLEDAWNPLDPFAPAAENSTQGWYFCLVSSPSRMALRTTAE